MNKRLVIIYDGKAWHVRKVRVIEHDCDNDEKVYRCDVPISNDHPSLDEAVTSAKAWLTGMK